MAQEQKAAQAATAAAAEGSLLDEIMQQTKLSPDQEGYDVARRGVSAFIGELLAPGKQKKADKTVLDAGFGGGRSRHPAGRRVCLDRRFSHRRAGGRDPRDQRQEAGGDGEGGAQARRRRDHRDADAVGAGGDAQALISKEAA